MFYILFIMFFTTTLLPTIFITIFIFSIMLNNLFSFYNLFILLLLLVSFVIFLYSLYYMDGSIWFFYYTLCLYSFILVMGLLVLSNGLTFLIFWDLLGMTSFLLVLFYLNWDSYTGSVNTLMANHFGDFFLILLVSLVIFAQFLGLNVFIILTIFLVLTSFTKSAQAIFLFWLPMAMSAPTPISSLVHSSTLVTGGLFLIFTNYWQLNIEMFLFLSIMTFFIAGLLSFFEVDLKKLVALSTLSQISFCMFVVIMMYFMNSFNHMMTHAFFKSCLFMCVGVQIYNSLGSQEFRSTKILNYIHKLMFAISVVSLCGLLYLSGLFSKDLILASIFSSNLIILLYLLFFMSVMMTYFYSLTLLKSLMGSSSLYLSLLSLFFVMVLPFVLTSGLMFFMLNIAMSFLWVESWVIFMFILFFLIFKMYSKLSGSLYLFIGNLPEFSLILNKNLLVDFYSFSSIFLMIESLVILKTFLLKYFMVTLMFLSFSYSYVFIANMV